MTAFSKAYTLLRGEQQRKNADILRRASNFATLAGYYRYRDAVDFEVLVAARHPLVMEAYPELYALKSLPDERSEPDSEEENLQTQSEGPTSTLKYIGPLAWEKVLYPGSVLTQKPEPVLESTPALAAPQETVSPLPNSVASDNEVRELGPSLPEEAPKVEPLPAEAELLPTKPEGEPKPEGELEPEGEEASLSLWGQLRPLLLPVVGEENFEIWLSSVRQGPVFEKLIIFEVPNLFFQEYLIQHYAPIIEDLLASLGEHRTFLFQAVAQEASLPTTTATKAPEPTQEATPKPPITKWERRLHDLERAREHCTVFDPIYGKHILRIKEHAMLLDLLKLKWADEDALPPATVPPIKLE